MAADPAEEVFSLLVAVPGEALLRGAALLVSSVDKPGADLTAHQVFTLADTDGIGSETYQNQGNQIITLEQ
jgi:hypothetical protein